MGVLFCLPTKMLLAAAFTIDTIDTTAFNPTTTPTLNWTVGASNMLIMTGAATPNANITAKLDDGAGGVYNKTGFGFPTSRWSISFENVKTGLYTVYLASESNNITFKINVTNTSHTGANTTPVPTTTTSPLEKYQTGNAERTIILMIAGVLFFIPVFLAKYHQA